MAVQTFNPTDLSQSAANWAVAQRIVGPFAPHAQVTPNLTLALDPGYLLNGTTLTEVNAQSVGPFVPPASGFRIDRVVIDRSTGAASVVTGTASSLTPPAIPTGKLPVARVMLQPTTSVITNDLIVDERALSDLTPQTINQVICRATRGGVDQTGIPIATYTKVLLNASDINIGGGFDTTNGWFKPSITGYYAVKFQCFMNIITDKHLHVNIRKNGITFAMGTGQAPVTLDITANTSGIVYMNGTTDYLEAFLYQNSSSSGILNGAEATTFLTATLLS